jgi:hypothetical protein
MEQPFMEYAFFITVEDGDDLIISFAIPVDEFGDVKSLTLLRTPKYEHILDESERGVRVFFDEFPEIENELLQQAEIAGDLLTITSNYRAYSLSLADVDDVEIEQTKRLLEKMNFDHRFQLNIA